MLLEFSVSNFGSFADEQTLSLVANSSKQEHPERIARVDSSPPINVLTSAIVLGKNGSGKSSFVEAMTFVRRFVIRSAASGQQGEAVDIRRFKRSKAFASMPSTFRLLFSVQTSVYQYTFSVNETRVLSESLEVADRTARFRRLYMRSYDDVAGGYSYSFGDALKGDKTTWRSATRENALFLSTAIQLNSDSLREPFDWIQDYFHAVSAVNDTFTQYTARNCDNAENASTVVDFLKSMDIDVEGFEFEDEDLTEALRNTLAAPFLEQLQQDRPSAIVRRVRFRHKSDGEANTLLDFKEESTGTQALFGLAGPMFDSLQHGYCLVVDEINTSLHPLALHYLVDLFSDTTINKRRAQLIFTSHDISLLRDSFFRRDQVWLVDKASNGRSELTPLTDYSPRKGEALDRGYLNGRYGGVPYICSPKLLSSDRTFWQPLDSD